MKNLDMYKSKIKEFSQSIIKALGDGDETKVNEAMEAMIGSVADSVRADYEAVQSSIDTNILVERGYRQLTSNEKKYWNAFIDANKAKDVKQAISNIEVAFPETEFVDIYKEMTDEHPLLKVINFQNVKTVTKWIMDDSSVDKAVWGELTDEVAKEISGAIKLVEMTQCKLSAYAVIPIDILDLGPEFVEGFVRRKLSSALYCGLEHGIVKGKGVAGEPIGLIRDIHNGVTVNTTTGYPEKTAVSVTNFLPATYGDLLAKLTKTEKGNYRTLSKVALVVNPSDYFKKIMPATTVMLPDGLYKGNVFPFPTEVVPSAQMDEDEAVLFVPEQYFFGIGTSADGKLEYDDSFKFLEDKRTFKIKAHANGRAYDNTVAIVLDISDLEPYFTSVRVNGVVSTEEVASATAEG